MQHPRLLCYTTIEIDLSRQAIETRFKDHNDLHNPLAISEIVRRCHSIPVTLRALLAKYRTAASVELTGGVAKKRGSGGGGGGSDGSGSSDDHMDNDDGCDDSKPAGGFTNGRTGAGIGGSGGAQSNDDCMEQDANHHHSNDADNCNENDEELHVAPRSLITHDHNGLVYTTLPNR